MTEPADPPDAPAGPDGPDRLLLAEAEAYAGRRCVVVDDVTGSLVAGLPDVGGWCCDSVVDERTVLAGSPSRPAGGWLDPALLSGARLVVARLPKSLAALDELAGAVAAYADPDVVLLAGGLVRHLSRGMNDVLGAHFGQVRATLGRFKARALVAERPTPHPTTWPQVERHDALDLTVCAHGGVFAGTGIDVGTRLLLGALDRLPCDAADVVDLGSGNGVLAVAAARALPGARVRGYDVSAAAVLSTRATAAANGVGDRVEVVRADGLEGVEPGSLDLVLCNPPFHRGTALDRTTTPRMFAEVGRALRPGGELWTVWNSHLPYLPVLRARVGSTSVLRQDPRFTVTRSTAPLRSGHSMRESHAG